MQSTASSCLSGRHPMHKILGLLKRCVQDWYMGPLQELESALKASPLQRLQGAYHATTVEYDWHGFVNKILLQPDPVSRLH